ncbi:glycosyltransferase [Vibrio crassostreae]|uniref:glycosyltransferase n=1 Tax=Vibrio crassostreae TaxID=246167 RepID=UPI001BD3C67B
MNVHIIGALPGELGGTTILLKQLVDDITCNDEINLEVSDTSDISSLSFFSKFKFLYTVFKRTRFNDITAVHVSANGSVTIAPITLIFCKLFGKRFNFRMFGGVYDKYYNRSNLVLSTIIKFLLIKSDLVYFETKHLVSYFSKIFPKANIKHYTNSRPLTTVRTADIKRNNFIFLGAIKESKGVNTILEASDNLISGHVDFYGPILEPELRRSIEESNNCYYKGICQHEDILDTLNGYKCLLLPTKHFGEGYPGVIIEAYSLGIPVITTDWQSIPEIVDNGITGFLIPPSDVKELNSKMSEVIGMDNKKYEMLSSNCTSYFNNNFDSRLLSEIYISDLMGLVGKHD